LNESFRSWEVLNDSFKTFAGAATPTGAGPAGRADRACRNGAVTAMQDAVRLSARLTEVDRGREDLLPALERHQRDLPDRGNAAVEVGKQALRGSSRPRGKRAERRSAAAPGEPG